MTLWFLSEDTSSVMSTLTDLSAAIMVAGTSFIHRSLLSLCLASTIYSCLMLVTLPGLRGAFRKEKQYLKLFFQGIYIWVVMLILGLALEAFVLDSLTTVATNRCNIQNWQLAGQEDCVLITQRSLKIGTFGFMTLLILFFLAVAKFAKTCHDECLR